ncbi:TPA: hypothetical protein ACX6NV_000594 [Photobacterium damselae]
MSCPLFIVDQFPLSELNRWFDIYEVEAFIRDPDKFPAPAETEVTVDESEAMLMAMFGVKKSDIGG